MVDQAEQSRLLNENVLAAVPRKVHARSMIPPFEVFQSEADGNVLWRGTATTLDAARERVRELAMEYPGQFIIMSRRTGQKLIVECDGKLLETKSAPAAN